jgi:hypothetical protein
LAAETAGNFREITLFPVRSFGLEEENSADNDGCSSGLESGLSVSKISTSGIEISSSAIFVPHASTPRHGLLWTYQIRMRLLRRDTGRPAALEHAQLARRHWICREPAIDAAGTATIGQYSAVTSDLVLSSFFVGYLKC